MKQLTISDPFPTSIGVDALTIGISEDFCGYATIAWRDPQQSHAITCRATPLLQGLFRSTRRIVNEPLTTDETLAVSTRLGARVIALVLHEFYKQRIQQAAQLEAVYQWQLLREEP